MKIAIVGSGGREHVIASCIRKNPQVEKIYVLPGNIGMEDVAIPVNISALDFPSILKFCLDEKIDYVVVGQDDPLANGLVDLLEEHSIPCFGPNKKAAQIEASKIFAQRLMEKYDIPTAKFEVFEKYEDAKKYLESASFPQVIKADGLALGKGVIIANNLQEGLQAIKSMMLDAKFGQAGNKIVIEEFLTGPEVSVLTFCDGKTILPMISSMDHKRAYDNNKGPNTGGMGTISPNPCYTKEIEEYCKKNIIDKTLYALNQEGIKFKGCLYFSLMLTPLGPKVIEYNSRFGDPEAQVVLPLLKNDLLDVMQHVSNETLNQVNLKFKNEYACCVILASKGYPNSYQKGYLIDLNGLKNVYFSGVSKKDGKLVTNGGRVLGIVNFGKSLQEAISNTYKDVRKISCENLFYRKDIGKSGIDFIKGEN